jgi:hypothetical protein
MFEEFGPANPPLPPAGALEQAMQRGKKIRRQRHASVASGLVLSAALIGGIALANPFQSNQGLVAPAETTPTTPPDYSSVPESPYDLTPAQQEDLDFGILKSITTANGVVTLHVDRTHFYEGAAAVAHGAGESEDWVTEDTDGEGKILDFTLDPKASLLAEAALRPDHSPVNANARVKLTQAQLVASMKYLDDQAKDDPDAAEIVYVWMRHTNGPNGPVTALVDQFTP